MARGAATQQFVGKHVDSIITHSVTIDLTDGTRFLAERAVRRVYVDSAGSGTLMIMTEYSSATITVATGETLDLAVRKILPASQFTRLKVYW